MDAGPLKIENLDKPYVCIVQNSNQPRGVIHQVTLRPDKVFRGLIRVGDTPGDELVGWNFPEKLYVLAVIGEGVETEGKWTCRPILEKAA